MGYNGVVVTPDRGARDALDREGALMIDEQAYDDLAYIDRVDRDGRFDPELQLVTMDQADVLSPALRAGQQPSGSEPLMDGRETRPHYLEQLEEQGWVRIRRGPGPVHWVRITPDGRTIAHQRSASG